MILCLPSSILYMYTNILTSLESAAKMRQISGLIRYVLVLINASRVLPEEDYRRFLSTINPAVIAMYNTQIEYWNSLYSKTLGRLQSAVYDAFLKGNKVSSGTASYLEVIDMVISLKDIPDLLEAEFVDLSGSEVFNEEVAG